MDKENQEAVIQLQCLIERKHRNLVEKFGVNFVEKYGVNFERLYLGLNEYATLSRAAVIEYRSDDRCFYFAGFRVFGIRETSYIGFGV